MASCRAEQLQAQHILLLQETGTARQPLTVNEGVTIGSEELRGSLAKHGPSPEPLLLPALGPAGQAE